MEKFMPAPPSAGPAYPACGRQAQAGGAGRIGSGNLKVRSVAYEDKTIGKAHPGMTVECLNDAKCIVIIRTDGEPSC